jgi:hypothetical protein
VSEVGLGWSTDCIGYTYCHSTDNETNYEKMMEQLLDKVKASHKEMMARLEAKMDTWP